MMSAHLSPREVELLYLGCGSEASHEHASECGPCATELASLGTQRDALLARLPAVDYGRRLERERARRLWRRRLLQRISGGLAIAAAASALMLRHDLDSKRPRLGVGDDFDGSSPPPAVEGAGSLLAKGDTTLSVVRKRGAGISILQGVVTVEPGDEIRIRFVCRTSGKLVAGILTDAGSWIPLFSDDCPLGVHTPDAALRVTEEPGGGVILLGTPEEVSLARAGQPARVRRARLDWMPGAARQSEPRHLDANPAHVPAH
jgi:hypothetical protein